MIGLKTTGLVLAMTLMAGTAAVGTGTMVQAADFTADDEFVIEETTTLEEISSAEEDTTVEDDTVVEEDTTAEDDTVVEEDTTAEDDTVVEEDTVRPDDKPGKEHKKGHKNQDADKDHGHKGHGRKDHGHKPEDIKEERVKRTALCDEIKDLITELGENIDLTEEEQAVIETRVRELIDLRVTLALRDEFRTKREEPKPECETEESAAECETEEPADCENSEESSMEGIEDESKDADRENGNGHNGKVLCRKENASA